MKQLSEKAQAMLHEPCFQEGYPGWGSCLSGLGFASVMGLCPWESRSALHERLRGRSKPGERTWEMERALKYRWWSAQVYERVSPSWVLRYNPYCRHFDGTNRIYVCDPTRVGVGGIIDGLLVNRGTSDITAGMMIKTVGLSSLEYWEDHPVRQSVAQALCLSGLCGGIDWVISTMFFAQDHVTGVESIPFEMRNYHLVYDADVFNYIYDEVKRYWDTNYLPDIKPEDYDSTEFTTILDGYIEKNTKMFRYLSNDQLRVLKVL